MTSRICSENQGWRPRSRVTDATSATRIAGRVATRLNRPTTRPCSRAAAAPARRPRPRPGEPRPNEALGLPRYHADEKQDEEAVQPEDRQDDLVRRDDRGRAGENEKRRERRPQRRDDRQRADPARAAGLRLEDAGVLAAALVDLVQTTPPIRVTGGIRWPNPRCGCMTTTLWPK